MSIEKRMVALENRCGSENYDKRRQRTEVIFFDPKTQDPTKVADEFLTSSDFRGTLFIMPRFDEVGFCRAVSKDEIQNVDGSCPNLQPRSASDTQNLNSQHSKIVIERSQTWTSSSTSKGLQLELA